MLRTVVVYGFSAALTIAMIAQQLRRGEGYFRRGETIFEHTTWIGDPIRKLPALLPNVAKILPRGETVACFEPVDGKVHNDYCSLVASGYLIRNRVVPFGYDPQWVVAVSNPFDDPNYVLFANFPDGRLYKKR